MATDFERKTYLILRKVKDISTGFDSTIAVITTDKDEADKFLKNYTDPKSELDQEWIDGSTTIHELDNILFHQFWIESVQKR